MDRTGKAFLLFLFLTVSSGMLARGQQNTQREQAPQQQDLTDLARNLLSKRPKSAATAADPLSANDKLHLSLVPAAGYTLQTGFAAVLSANLVFYADPRNRKNVSSILTSLTYSQYKQVIFPIEADLWFGNGKYNIVTDWRYLKYPSTTYGLGGLTSPDSGYSVDYSYLKLHQAILRKIAGDLYAGLGYDIDYLWNIKEIDPPPGKPTDFQQYGFNKKELSSGISFHLQYDARRNIVNPENGAYASINYRPNFTFMGSDRNWQSLVIDLRAYRPFPAGSHNTLALWSYSWLTPGGNPPYLLLPSTGWDAYSNTGRGYIQGRFRSKNMLYLEGEYRFGITPNGLLGGVVFLNGESFSQPVGGRFEAIAPGYGGGIRIRLNKYAKTNLCIDYGIGQKGSGGFFVNLGEVF